MGAAVSSGELQAGKLGSVQRKRLSGRVNVAALAPQARPSRPTSRASQLLGMSVCGGGRQPAQRSSPVRVLHGSSTTAPATRKVADSVRSAQERPGPPVTSSLHTDCTSHGTDRLHRRK